MRFYCYILECADRTFYTGWTMDPARREKQHNTGRGARYTRARLPVRMIYIEELASRSEAMKRERVIKRMTRTRKLKLMNPRG